MWGTFLSEPLRIVATVGRYPAVQLMRRMPILPRMIPFLPRGCPRGMYAGLASLSEGCPPGKGRLHTCYSPVRQSPAGSASAPPDALRLACVKPAASVHPEPGSNSPLFISFFFFQIFSGLAPLRKADLTFVCLDPRLLVGIDTGTIIVPCISLNSVSKSIPRCLSW